MFVLRNYESRKYAKDMYLWTEDLQEARVFKRKCDVANSTPYHQLRKSKTLYEIVKVGIIEVQG